jgi:opacity protein-like surface antigen
MRLIRPTLLAVVLLATMARSARADATIFLGANVTPSNRPAKGFAVEFGLLFVGFEFEYSSTSDDVSAQAPSLKAGMGNVLLQTPFPIFGFQPYFTTGGGIYREELGAHEETGVGLNTGGGVKIALAGPLRLRVDYRVFNLGSGALNSPAHRVYAGLNLAF